MEIQQAELEISYIKKLMRDSRRTHTEAGWGYIMWGVLVVIGIMYNYLRIIGWGPVPSVYVWIAVITIGWIITFFSAIKRTKSSPAYTMADKILGNIWLAAGVGMTLVGFVGTMSGAIGGYAILPMMGIILGMAYFVSGNIYRERWIKFIGIGWWLMAIVFFMWKDISTLPIFAFLIIIFQIVPGFYFYKKWRKELSQNQNLNGESA